MNSNVMSQSCQITIYDNNRSSSAPRAGKRLEKEANIRTTKKLILSQSSVV